MAMWWRGFPFLMRSFGLATIRGARNLVRSLPARLRAMILQLPIRMLCLRGLWRRRIRDLSSERRARMRVGRIADPFGHHWEIGGRYLNEDEVPRLRKGACSP